VFLNGTGGSRKGEICMMTQDVGSHNAKDRSKCGQSLNLGALRSKIRCETNSRRIDYGDLFGGEELNFGLKSGFSTMTMPLRMTRQVFARSWLRNPLQK
jgi:hypothetical protein